MMLTPSEVVDRLLAGMRRNAQSMARLSYGEPTMYWEHTRAVIGELIERTRDQRMHVPGFTPPEGDPMGIVVETNGSLLTVEQLSELEGTFGEDAGRIVLGLGMKATHPEALAELTGMTLKTCERFHRRQLDALMHVAYELEHLQVHTSFLDRFTDPGIYAALLRAVEGGRPGMSRECEVLTFKRYPGAGKGYVPKRLRAERRDLVDADDPELVRSLAPASGVAPRPLERTEFDLVAEPEEPEAADRGEQARMLEEHADAFEN